MPFLQQQIEIVNTLLKAGPLNEQRFQSGRYEAIAVDVSRVNNDDTKIIMPAVIIEGEPKYVGIDDTYPIIIYHRILSSSYSPLVGSVGDGNKDMRQVTTVKMVVYGKRSALRLNIDELEGILVSGFPDSIPAALVAPLKLQYITVGLQRSNLNSLEVFAQEYKGVEVFIGAEDLLFSIEYQIESRFRKGCFPCPC